MSPSSTEIYRDTTKTRTSTTTCTSTFKCFLCGLCKAILGSKRFRDANGRMQRKCKGCSV